MTFAIPAISILDCAFYLGLIILFIWNNTRIPNYWKETGVPHVKPRAFFISVFGNLNKPRHVIEEERYKKYGAIYGHFEGKANLLSVADPKLVKNILVKDFHCFMDRRTLKTGDTIAECMLQNLQGEEWKRVRSIVSPTFTTGKIKRMMGIFKRCSRVLVDNFMTAVNDAGKPVEVKKFYSAFTMDVIASSAFSTKLDSHNNPNNEFVRTARSVFQRGIHWRFIFYLLFPRLMRLFRVAIFPPEGTKFFSKVTLEIIKERERTGQTGEDFLQLLIDATKESNPDAEAIDKKDDLSSNYAEDTNDQVFRNYVPAKKNLTHDELVAQCVIFFLAGFETTATTLSFATYQLALNQEVQNKLIKELDDTIKASKGELNYEAIQNMKCLDNVISETLRMHPPAIRLERRATENYRLRDTGIIIPKGTIVTIPVYAIQHDAKYFHEPEKFDPDRFTSEEKVKRDLYTFMPFGAGPRNCVAMRFALLEIKVCLASVLCHFRIKKCPETKVPLDYHIGHGLLQPKEVIVYLEKREDSPLLE